MHYRKKFEAPQQNIMKINRVESGSIPELGKFRLVSLVAPAGFGKSTLLAQYLETLTIDANKVWINLDFADRDPVLFLSGLISAIESTNSDIAITKPNPEDWKKGLEVEQVLAELLAKINSGQRKLILVLDNYQHVESEPVNAIVETILESEPDNIQLCIASRSPIQMSLAKYFSQGLGVQITGDELSFSYDEIELLFSGTAKGVDEIAGVLRSTGGWPVAVQLIRMWLCNGKEREFSDVTIPLDLSHIGEYIEQWVYSELTGDEKDFFIKLSILEKFDMELADAVRGGEASAKIVDGLLHLYPLLSRKKVQGKYIYFFIPLVKKFFEERLAKTGASKKRELHSRAAACFEEKKDTYNAVMHACAAKEYDGAGRAFLRAGGARSFMLSGVHLFRQTLNLLPRDIVQAYPRIQLSEVAVLLKEGLFKAAKEQLDYVRRRTKNYTYDWSGDEVDALRADAALIETLYHVYCGSIGEKELPRHIKEALSDSTHDPHLITAYTENLNAAIKQQLGELGDAERSVNAVLRLCEREELYFQQAYAYLHSGLIAFARGKLPEAHLAYQKVLKIINEKIPGDVEIHAMVQVLIAEARYEQNDHVAAAMRLHQSLDVVEQTEGWFDIYAAGFVTAAALAFSSGGLAAALEVLQRAESKASERGIGQLKKLIDACRVNYLFRMDNKEAALQLAGEVGLFQHWPAVCNKTDSNWRVRDVYGLAMVRSILVLENYHEASGLVNLLMEDMLGSGRMGAVIKLKILQSIIAQRQGETGTARKIMHEAIRIALPRNYLRPFIDEEREYLKLLNDLQLTEGEQTFVKHILDVCKTEDIKRQGQGVLNVREVEVLRGLSEGHSNKQIARDLNLSDNTVKYHLKRIYAQLYVHNRREAILEAQKRGLLPE